MAHWIGAQGQSKLVKNSKTPPLCDVPPRETLTQIKLVFLIETRRIAESIDDLNSSLIVSAGELWRWKLGEKFLDVGLTG